MSSANNSLPYLLALGSIPGIGAILAKQLISYCGSAEAVFSFSEAQLKRIPKIGRSLAYAITQTSLLKTAHTQLQLAQKQGVAVYSYLSPYYPERLRHAPDGPLVLFVKGEANLNANRVISIVGTRKATPYGKAAVSKLLNGLASYNGLLVVSGLAYGIDIAAHRECLRLGIPTVGIQANGLGTIYPPVHAGTATQMIRDGGALISEYPMDTKPDAHRFPSRNRIIAGMADVVVVVEAKQKGGALITADLANSYDREVCAIPGDIRQETYKGCHKLIQRNQAHLITGAEDLVELMGWDQNLQNGSQLKLLLSLENPEEKQVGDMLQKSDMQIDELSFHTGIPINKLAGILLNLEFRGLVRVSPGKVFGLIRK